MNKTPQQTAEELASNVIDAIRQAEIKCRSHPEYEITQQQAIASTLLPLASQIEELRRTCVEKDTMLNGLTNSVTALALAIDPSATHGTETSKIVEYEKEIRDKLKLLLTNMYDDAVSEDTHGHRNLVLKLVELLGCRDEIRNSLWPKKPITAALSNKGGE